MTNQTMKTHSPYSIRKSVGGDHNRLKERLRKNQKNIGKSPDIVKRGRGRPRKIHNNFGDLAKAIEKDLQAAVLKQKALFDLNDLSDLEDQIKSELFFPKTNADNQILELFRYKKQLTLNEIIVGLYREHKEIPHRATIYSRCDYMRKKGILEKVPGKTGTFKLAD